MGATAWPVGWKRLTRFLEDCSRIALPLAGFALVCLIVGWDLGASFGVPKLFRDDPGLRYRSGPWWLDSPGVWGDAGATLLLLTIWAGHVASERKHGRMSAPLGWWDTGRFVLASASPFLVFLLCAIARPEYQRSVELPEGLAGVAIAFALAAAASLLVGGMGRVLAFGAGASSRAAKTAARVRTVMHWITPPSHPDLEHATNQFWAFVLTVAILSAPVVLWSVIVPAIAITTLLVWVTLGYFLALHIRPTLRVPVAAVIAAALIFGNRNPYFDRFPGFSGGSGRASFDYYAEGHRVDFGERPGGGAALVRPIDALDAWRRAEATRPPLVVVATSGGAYRAAFWTGMVLDEMASRPSTRPLARSVRLLTGASGGMVASAYFAALAPRDRDAPWPSVEEKLREDIFAFRDRGNAAERGPFATTFPSDRDGLSPVAQQLLQRDVVRYLTSPLIGWNRLGDWDLWHDRGLVLEEQWRTLGVTFAALAPGIREGWRPAILLSPMMVETGQPLLISSIDLGTLVRDAPEAEELFARFPAAFDTLLLRTAVRMNASFPYVSPAVSLPADPPRRVVDAGYYDNYGVNVAAMWLSDPDVRTWVTKNTRGVVLVEIRAEPTTAPPWCHQPPNWAGVASQGLTTPMEGVASARSASMRFRNEQEIRSVQALYPDRFVIRCQLENHACPEDVAVSWDLWPGEVAALRAGLMEADFGCLESATRALGALADAAEPSSPAKPPP
jgi:hypothetical protein